MVKTTKTLVYKFGGALLKDAEGISRMADILQEKINNPPVVVISALGKTTNALEQMLQNAIQDNSMQEKKYFYQLKEFHFNLVENLFSMLNSDIIFIKLENIFEGLSKDIQQLPTNLYQAYDLIVSYGEKLSGVVVENYLNAKGLNVKLIDATQIIVTDSNYTSADINWLMTRKTIEARLKPLLKKGNIILTQGFTGADEKANTTTLGREGSDFTAAILAKCLQASAVTIWKDVRGLMSADPHRFSNTVKLRKVSYSEAIELAFYGASVVHPKTIQPLQQMNIPLFIRYFYDVTEEPTLISTDSSEDEKFPKIIIKDNQCLLSIRSRNLSFVAEENLSLIFSIFNRNKVHINLMQNSAVSFTVCFDDSILKRTLLMEELNNNFSVKYNTGLQLISIRNAGNELIEKFTTGKTVYLKQASRKTVCLLIKTTG